MSLACAGEHLLQRHGLLAVLKGPWGSLLRGEAAGLLCAASSTALGGFGTGQQVPIKPDGSQRE